MQTVAFCEIDRYCQRVLRKHWPDVPIYDDVRTIHEQFTGTADLICGGFPCQPFSTAGKRRGKEDDRHLWPAMLDCITHYRPTWVIGENVAGFVNMALDDVLSDLEGAGYTARPFIIPAVAVDAKHRRDRVWIVGHAEHHRSPAAEKSGVATEASTDDAQGTHTMRQSARTGQSRHGADVANTTSELNQRLKSPVHTETEREGGGWKGTLQPSTISTGEDHRGRSWPAEPELGRVANGIPGRVDRIRALGNSVVPQIVEEIGYAIMQKEINRL